MSRQLLLRSNDIEDSNTPADYFGLTIVNGYGRVAQNRTSLTWYNVDMRKLLGELYDEYNTFTIRLNFICGSSTGATAATDEDNRNFVAHLSGLPFQRYNFLTKQLDSDIVLTSFEIPLGAGSAWSHSSPNNPEFIFNKCEYANISLDLKTVDVVDTYYACVEATMIGHVTVAFDIQPYK